MMLLVLIAVLTQEGPIRTAPPPVDAPAAARLSGEAETGSGTTAGEGRPDSPSPNGVQPGERRYGRLRAATGREAGPEVPGWALSDPARWETSQCGADGDEACRRQARNRLAMARAGAAAEAPAAGGGPSAAPQNCRMVMQRSESGFGGSLTRVCGDGVEAGAAADRLQDFLRPAPEPCDRPASLETQEAWIARCRALPPR